jgi:hypothetical protein
MCTLQSTMYTELFVVQMFLIAGAVLAENDQPSRTTVSWRRLCSHEVYLGMMVGGGSCKWPLKDMCGWEITDIRDIMVHIWMLRADWALQWRVFNSQWEARHRTSGQAVTACQVVGRTFISAELILHSTPCPQSGWEDRRWSTEEEIKDQGWCTCRFFQKKVSSSITSSVKCAFVSSLGDRR